MLRKRLFTLSLAMLLAGGVLGPDLSIPGWSHAQAQSAARRIAPTVALSTDRVAAGATVGIAGTGFHQREAVSLVVISATRRQAVAAGQAIAATTSGAFVATVAIPADTATGSYLLVARGALKADVARARLAVTHAGAAGARMLKGKGGPTPTTPAETATPVDDGGQQTPAPSATPSPGDPAPTATGSEADTATSTPTAIPSATATDVPSPTDTDTASATPTPSNTPAATDTATATATTSAPPAAPVPGGPSNHARVSLLQASPSTVRAGGSVTIRATGFPHRATADLLLLSSASSAPIMLASLRVNADGAVDGTAVTIPMATPAGAYALQLTAQDGASSAGAALTVLARTATIEANPTNFTPQSTIAVSGAGFAAGEQIALSLNAPDGSSAIALGALQADAHGVVAATAVHIPFGVASGTWLLQATGAVSTLQATTPVTIIAQTASATVAPSTAAPRDTVTVTGAHFQPNEAISVDIVTVAATIHLGDSTAGADGSVALSGLPLPPTLPGGAAAIVVTGLASHLTASAQCTIVAPPAGIRASRTQLEAGGGLTIDGSGFLGGETVSIVLDGGPQAPLSLAQATVDTTGTFAGLQVVVPSVTPAGTYMLSVAGLQSGRQAALKLIVQAPRTDRPMLGIVSQPVVGAQGFQANPGALMQVAGSHFPRNAPVTLRIVGVSRGAISVKLAPVPASGRLGAGVTGAAAGLQAGTASRFAGAVAHVSSAPIRAALSDAATAAPASTLVTLKADANGNLGPAGVALPATLASGSYMVQAVVGRNQVASTAVRLRDLHPQLALSPSALAPGRTITVRGLHFAPGEQVVLALNSRAVATTPRTVLADRGGNFTARFVTPTTLESGANALTASGVASRVSTTTRIQAHLPPSAHWYFADGDTTSGHGTSMSLVNPNARAATVHMSFLYQGAPSRSYTMRLGAHAHAQLNLVTIAGAGRLFSTIVDADQQIGALSTISYGAHIVATTLGAPAPAAQWYLAEGYTGGTFQEYLKVMNPNSGFATVDVRFLPFNGRPPKNERFLVRPRSAIQIDVRRYMPLASVGSIITADKGIVVSRTMRFGTGSRAAHQTIGSTQAATVWLFGQGNTAVDRQTFLTIANLNQATTAIVTATFLDARGQPLATHTIFIQPLRRGNIKLNDLLPHAQTSVVLTSNVPVVAERAQYQGPSNLDHASSGSVLLGCNSGSNTWLFPNATTTPGENTRIYLFNPSLTSDRVTATFYTDGGRVISKELSIPVDASTVIEVNRVPDLPKGAVGVQLSSTGSQVFVAEQGGDNTDFGSVSASAGIP